MTESSLSQLAIWLLLAGLIGALIWLARTVLTVQRIVANPSAQLTSGIVAVQSEQTRVAQELGRAAQSLVSLQGAQQNLDAALRTLAGQADARAQAENQSRELLRRLELVIAGSFHRGAAGENLLAEVLSVLPSGMLDRNLRFAGGLVEFAVRLPGGKYIPIDSKWPGVELLERLAHETDISMREQLVREIEYQVSAKADEVAKYLDPERTLLLGIAAMPDAVYQVSRGVHSQAYKRGVVLLPYSLAIPYVLSMFVLIARFGGALDTSRVRSSMAKLDETLSQLEGAIESHMNRGLTMFSNAVQNQRSGVAACRSILAALQARDEATSLLDESKLTLFDKPAV